ncbi:G5 domain-containing protein [Ruania suaedae]|uniref:aggregation-promoting factor C-terminal-like domain-containing protein n=1 Tax=Ruania suaedae TaxID=2897774 RepID=UPI001E5C138E|nr:G5 domain-containing protein [Ruania suaedae]UFU03801.1 G5 domain-containing protein [Ruania suaedae]
MPHPSTPSRHRADAPVTTSLPRPVRRALGAAGLAVVLGGSLAFGASQRTDGAPDQQADLAGASAYSVERTDYWNQVSRGGDSAREALDEAGEPVTFSVTVDDREVEITSNAARLADALIENGIVVGLDDNVSAPMNSRPSEGMDVRIERVGTVFGTESETLEYETIERETADLVRGETRVETEGQEGSRVLAYTAVHEGGEEVSRTTTAEILVSEPVDEVVLVGTAEPQPAASPSGSSSSSGSSGSSSSGSSSSQPSAPTESYSGSDPRSIARQMVQARGWGADQWSCLDSLWQRESNWNPHAQNPSSGAYGIPQSLPGNKMASVASDWRTNPVTQITWGLNYISGRYGSPCGAWGHSESVGWY